MAGENYTVTRFMSTLWNRALPTLDEEDLVLLSGAVDTTWNMTISLQDTLIGLGALVADDNYKESVPVGSFQENDSVSALLFAVSNSLDCIAVLTRIGSDARHMLSERRMAQVQDRKKAEG